MGVEAHQIWLCQEVNGGLCVHDLKTWPAGRHSSSWRPASETRLSLPGSFLGIRHSDAEHTPRSGPTVSHCPLGPQGCQPTQRLSGPTEMSPLALLLHCSSPQPSQHPCQPQEKGRRTAPGPAHMDSIPNTAHPFTRVLSARVPSPGGSSPKAGQYLAELPVGTSQGGGPRRKNYSGGRGQR